MQQEYNDISIHDLYMKYSQWTGDAIGGAFSFGKGGPGTEGVAARPPRATQLRPLFHAMLHHQLERFGIQVLHSIRVVEYFEEDNRGIAGVLTEDGQRFEADIVIAADGMHSRSRALVPTATETARPTGRTVFRCAFPLDIAISNPLVKETFGLKDGKSPLMQVWLGPDTHAVVLSYVDKCGENGRMCMGLTFREPAEQVRKESWHSTISSDEVLAVMDRLPGWGEAMKALVRTIPSDCMIAWPLNPRNPNPTWHSHAARILQLGDAAHAFLPTSGNGATQAMEDAVTIAACLDHAGAGQVPTAVKVHNLLRSERVSCCQLLGFANAERLQKTDRESVGQDPRKVQQKVPRWVWDHDPEQYADEHYTKAAASLALGAEAFTNSNIPVGYTPKPWTIDEIEKKQEAGQSIELQGDWT